MRFSKFQFKKSIFISWLLSYMVILIIPILINIIVYMRSTVVLGNEINRANDLLLSQVQQMIDNQVKDIEKLCIQVNMNSKVNSIMYQQDNGGSESSYTKIQIIDDFKAYRLSSGYVYDFYVYFKNQDMVLSPSAKYDKSFAFQVFHENDGMTYDEWLKLMEKRTMGSYISIPKHGQVESRRIIYTQSMPLNTTLSNVATIVVLLDENKIQNLIKSVEYFNGGVVFVLDNENRLLSSSKSLELPESIENKLLSGGDGIFKELFYGEKVAVSFKSSQVNGWKYVSVLPVKIASQKVEDVKKLGFGSFIGCMIFGVLFSYYFVTRNYNPIEKMMASLTEKTGISRRLGVNEYSYINEALSSAFNEKEQVLQTMKKQGYRLRSAFLTDLLKGKLNGEMSLEESLNFYQLNFETGNFAVMLFFIEEYRGFKDQKQQDRENGEPEDKLPLVRFIIGSVVEELAGKKHKGYIVELDDMVACLVNLRENDEGVWKKALDEIAEEARQFLGQQTNIFVTVSVSSVAESCEAIPKAYYQAMDAMQYRLLMGKNSIINYEDIADFQSKDTLYHYDVGIEQNLMNSIKAGDFEKASGQLTEIMDKNFRQGGGMSVQMAKCLMFDLTGTMIKTFSHVNTGVSGQSFFEDLNPMDRLLKCETAEEMEAEMLELLKKFCQLKDSSKKSHNTEVTDNVMAWVQEHYWDSNLNISTIGNMLDMNPVYLSRLFKEQTGENLLDYINRVRINRSKELLKEESLTVDEIAAKVGYTNSNSYFRLFKKHEGITPRKYRG